ncbi:MAG: DUF58 domain-containing protein [Pirellulales bacterium]|nr:DUF58 domain-containing protein [Pirellulales bacterium]
MPADSPPAGVAVTLDELVRLRFRRRSFSLLPRQPVRSLLAGRRASRLRGRGLNFDEIRRYQPGDDVRHIDWKATVRTRQTQTRVYTEERERSVLLVVDQRRSMFFGSVRHMKSVVAAQAAALAAWRVLAQQDRVGAIVFNDERLDEIRPQRRQAAVMRLLRAVVDQNQSLAARPDGPANPGKLNESLRRCRRLLPHDGLACIISDGAGHDAETNRVVTEIARHNDVLFAFTFDPLEAELPAAGRLAFGDGGRQLDVNSDDAKLREQFARRFAEERAVGRRFLLARETPVLQLSAAEDAAPQLARQLGRRRR